MQLTRESEYALLGLASLAARRRDTSVPLAEIAKDRALPPTFLAKIFQKLARHGLLSARRGRRRGYALARPASSITIREILESVEGPELFEHCILWSGHGEDNPCPLHEHGKMIVSELARRLESVTLAQYAASLEPKQSVSKV